MSYKILEYIQSSGTQYIDTGLRGDTIGRIQMEFKFVNLNTVGTWRTPIGAEINSSPYNTIGVRLTSSDIFRLQYGASSATDFTDITPTADVLYTIDLNGIDGTGTWNNITLPLVNTGAITTNNLYIFGINNSAFNNAVNMKLYSCKIYNTSGDLVRDYIPVDFNGIACLYDQTRQYLQYNNGSGSFIKGPETGEEIVTDHTPSPAQGTYRVVKYLQNNGGQIIDTCYKPNNNTRMRAKINHLDNTATWRHWFGTWGRKTRFW